MFGWIEQRNSCRPGRSNVKRMTASRWASRNTPPIPVPYVITPAVSILVGTPSNMDDPKSWRSGSTLRIAMTVGTPKRSGIAVQDFALDFEADHEKKKIAISPSLIQSKSVSVNA